MPEHVSLFYGRAKVGKRQAIIDQMNKWEREQKPQAEGFVRSILCFVNDDPDQFAGVVRWDNTENYFANANRAEQDAWYQELMQNVDGEISWLDTTLAGEWKA